MKNKFFICILFFGTIFMFLLGCSSKHQNKDVTVIPLPQSVVATGDGMQIPEKWNVNIPYDNPHTRKVAEYLKSELNAHVMDQDANLRLEVCDTLPDEAYLLDVDSDGVTIQSSESGAGWFYGVQTLIQMINGTANGKIAGVSVSDRPRFKYRGAMIDHGRWFLGKEETLRLIDLMAFYKMNTLHLHLTDDQGWRLQIDRYPKLTEVGAWRPYTQVGHSNDSIPATFDGIPHGGFFTKDDIREILDYADSRFITVIPEIEMPGHASAALAAYPELSCGLGKTYKVQPEFDVFDEVFCPTDSTIRFLCNVLDEVMDLFPSKYIHIGGDECPKKAWAKCVKCQKRIKELGLANEAELQSWFITQINNHVTNRGRQIIGWDEILEGGLASGATVISWRGEKGGIEAALKGHDAIMAPQDYCYLDYYQEDPDGAPLAMGGYTPIDSVYMYDPIPREIPDTLRHHIIGTQGNVWGEYIPDSQKFEYMAFPRLLAVVEVQWTNPERKSFDDFMRRLQVEFVRLDSLHVNAYKPH